MKIFITQEVIPRIVSLFSQRALRRLNSTRLILPYYHIVSDDKAIHVCNLYSYKGTRQFTEDLDFLLKHFIPIGLDDLLKAINSGDEFQRHSFHLTFDDGFRELYDVVAPILTKKGIPATFFVNSDFMDNKVLCYQHKASILIEKVKEGIPISLSNAIGDLLKCNGISSANLSSSIMSVPYSRKEVLDELAVEMMVDLDGYLAECKPYLDSSQLLDLIGKGFTVGSHSIDHPLYANISFDEQVRQTLDSTRWTRETYRLGYGAFAFPHMDKNVEGRFYTEIRESCLVDISFGTGGMINSSLSCHLQRFSLERPLLPAERIINIQYAKKILGQARNKNSWPGRV